MRKSHNMVPVVVGGALLASLASTGVWAAGGSSGALAIDKRNGELYGWAIDYATQQAASERATTECSNRGGKCQVVLEFSGGCGAYAVERGNPSLYGWGTAGTRQEAEARALSEARQRGGKDVLIRVWGCSSAKPQSATASAAPSDGGIFFLYAMRLTTKGASDKSCFVSNPFYVRQVARKNGEEWAFNSAAPALLAPYVAKFDAAIKAKYPSAAANLDGGWQGGNEITTLSPKMPNAAKDKRRKMMDDGAAAVKQDCVNRGYTIVSVPL